MGKIQIIYQTKHPKTSLTFPLFFMSPPVHLFKEALCCPGSLERDVELAMPILVIFITFYIVGVHVSGGDIKTPSAQLIFRRLPR